MSTTRAKLQDELQEIKVTLRALLYRVERLQTTKRVSRPKQNSISSQDSQLRIEFPDDEEVAKGANS
jgi:hypothetical protein